MEPTLKSTPTTAFDWRIILAIFVASALVALGIFGGLGNLAGALYMLAIVAFVVAALSLGSKRWILKLFFYLAAIAMLIAIVDTGASPAARQAAHQASCLNNLKNLGEALQQYMRAKETLPAVYTLDSAGQPLTSWRTSVLPYLEKMNLYSAYQLQEPWNSDTNKAITNIPLELLVCPSDDKVHNAHTNYVAIIAPGSAWQPGKKTEPGEITDKPSDTILLVEMQHSGIDWAEPRDLDLSNLPTGLTLQNLLESLSPHKGAFNALFADGHVESIPTTIPWSDFLAMLTIAGGETIDRSKWPTAE